MFLSKNKLNPKKAATSVVLKPKDFQLKFELYQTRSCLLGYA